MAQAPQYTSRLLDACDPTEVSLSSVGFGLTIAQVLLDAWCQVRLNHGPSCSCLCLISRAFGAVVVIDLESKALSDSRALQS